MADKNEEVAVVPETTEETETSPEATRVVELEAELSKRDETIGSLKRDVKDAKKSKTEVKKETPEKTETKPDESINERLDRQALKSAEITHEDDVQLARDTAEKWNIDLDALVDDEDFKVKLEKQRDARTNAEATSNVKGDKGKVTKTNSAEYYIAKGEAPTREQVPDRKERVKIVREMMAATKSGKKFYND